MGLVLGIFSSSDTIEGVGDVTASITRQDLDQRSYNPVRDEVFSGNETAYVISELGISIATGTIASRVAASAPARLATPKPSAQVPKNVKASEVSRTGCQVALRDECGFLILRL